MPAAAVIYARSSKDRSDISTQTQVHELSQLAASRSLTVVRTFEDAVALGSTDDRPAFGELVAAIKNPRRGWDTILCYDTSRIARGRHIAGGGRQAELDPRGDDDVGDHAGNDINRGK